MKFNITDADGAMDLILSIAKTRGEPVSASDERRLRRLCIKFFNSTDEEKKQCLEAAGAFMQERGILPKEPTMIFGSVKEDNPFG